MFLFLKVQILNVFTMCRYLMLQKNIWTTDPQFQLFSSFTIGRILVANMFLYKGSMYVTQCVVCELSTDHHPLPSIKCSFNYEQFLSYCRDMKQHDEVAPSALMKTPFLITGHCTHIEIMYSSYFWW